MNAPAGHTTQLQIWLNLLNEGDERARSPLIEHACERLRLLARRMLRRFPKVRRWEETDDVLTEALTRLHRSLETTQPESPRHFYNLAATQIRRVLIDMARRYHGPMGLGANYDTGAADGDDGQTRLREVAVENVEPTDLMEWTEFHQQVEGLPEQEREVFSLLWYEGLTQEEAAEVLGMSKRTLRRRWQDARYRIVNARRGEPLPE
jgi:RNA polymerase sigma-70 factor (ECF subfamily)